MEQASRDGMDVSEILHLLHTAPALVAVTLQWPDVSGSIRITIRKVAQHRDGRTHSRYAWEAWGGAGQDTWGRAEGPAYDSPEAAYQAATNVVQVVHAARRDQWPDQPQYAPRTR